MKDENVHNDMITAYFEEIEKKKNDPTSVFDGILFIIYYKLLILVNVIFKF